MGKRCVIIGAGLGGLSCGVVLARHGYDVTLLEQERQAGGCLQTFVRNGVSFETGMHYIGSAGKGEILDTLLRYLGIRDGLKLHSLDAEGYDRVNFKGQDFRFCKGQEAFVDELARYFPHQKDNLVRYISTVYKASVSSSVESFNPERTIESTESVWHTRSVDSVIDELIDDAELRQILAGNQPLYAGRKGHTPFSLHAFITSFYNRSAWRIAGGSDRIALGLADVIRNAGGRILTGCKVTGIVCDESHAVGVRAMDAGGETVVPADMVISAIHPAITVGMVESALFRPAFRKRILEIPNTIGVFELYLQFKEDKVPYMNSNRFIYRGATVWDSESYCEQNWPRSFLYMHQCPDGGTYAKAGVILAYMRYDEVAEWAGTVTGRRGDDYARFKQRKAEALLRAAADHIPELRDGVERYWTSTPLTYRDYTGAIGGGLYGIAKDVELGQSGRVSYRTRVPNLYLAGQSVNSHGILGVLVGSMVVCDSILAGGILYNDIRRTVL